MLLWIDDYTGILFIRGENGEIISAMLIEIDWIIRDLNTKFSANLTWLETPYERALTHVKKVEGTELKLPQVFTGKTSKNVFTHISPLPNSKNKTILFYTVGDEEPLDFKPNTQGYLKWKMGIIFWVNLNKIDPAGLDDVLFTQSLIKEARDVIKNKLLGCGYQVTILNVQREVEQVYKEFDLPEFKSKNYLYAPFSGFRFNVEVTMRESC